MTINYLDSKRIVKLSTDTVQTLSYENTSAVSIGTGDSGTSIDLTGSTLSNSWVLRFKLTMTSKANNLIFMVQDINTIDETTTRDGIGLRQTASTSYYDFEGCNGTAPTGGQYDHRFTTVPAIDTKYIQVTRISETSAKIEFCDSSYTVLESSGNITIADITNLRYFVIYNNGSALTVDDIDFWNGVSSITTKPTNVQDNSILVEKDTGRRYWRTPYSSGTGKIDDLTTDKGWTTSNGIAGNGYNASDYVDFKLICPDSSSLAGGRVLVDLQHADYLNGSNLSNTAFTARIKINYSALDQASQNENKSYIGFYSNDSWGGSTQDAFVLQLKLDYGQSSKKFYVEIMNDEVFEGSAHQTEFTSTTPTVDTDYYVEFTKNGNVHTIRITTNDDYTGGETQSITYGGVENLRYFGCKARGDTQANGGNAQGKIEPDIGIWNGVTTVDSTPATWTMEPTFEDDFSTIKGWTNLTSNTSVTTQLNYTETDSTYIRATKDLQDSNALGSGNNMSDNFVIRFGLNKTNDATNTANGTQPLIGISSATTDGWFNNQDSIGMILSQDTNQTHSIRAVGADNQYTHQGDSADAAYTWTTGIRYCEVIKNATADTVTATLYSDSDYTGSLVTATVSTSGKTFSGLRYLSMRNFADNGRSSTVWKMNNIQVYDGVTTIN